MCRDTYNPDPLDTGDEDWADGEDPLLDDPTLAFHPAGCDCEGCVANGL